MNKTIPLTLLIFVLGVLFVTGLSLNDRPKKRVDTSPTPTAVPSQSVPSEYTSGDSRFSRGSCETDEDCVVSGCSGEVCGNEEYPSTCEFSEDFPNTEKYSCGCVNKVCGWQ